jgi:hypothetical protein
MDGKSFTTMTSFTIWNSLKENFDSHATPCWDLSALDYGALCGVEIEMLCVLRIGECSTMFVLYLHNNFFRNFALIKLSFLLSSYIGGISFHFFSWSFCFLWIFSCKESSITYTQMYGLNVVLWCTNSRRTSLSEYLIIST